MAGGHSKSTVDVLISEIQNSLKNSVDGAVDLVQKETRSDVSTTGEKERLETPYGLLSTQVAETITGDSVKDEKKFQKMIVAQGAKKVDLENLNTRYSMMHFETFNLLYTIYVSLRAMEVILRIQSKLTGRDFSKDSAGGDELTVDEQVEKLIQQAVCVENLCDLFQGWCPFW